MCAPPSVCLCVLVHVCMCELCHFFSCLCVHACLSLGGLLPELQEDDEVENDTNETAPNISLNVTVTKRTQL